MTRKNTLAIEPLTAKAFAAFGDVIEANEQCNHFSINNGNTTRFHDLMKIAVDEQGHPIVSIFRGLAREMPFEVKMMEKHPLGSQSFMPLQKSPYLVVVAPQGEKVNMAEIKVFYCQGNQGINYAPGVWHHPLLALEQTSDFLVIDRAGPGNNCVEYDLPESGWLSVK